jgi:NAD(P)-dependent dehydrogenase (short-subunit alcohol dehydrogenase family)
MPLPLTAPRVRGSQVVPRGWTAADVPDLGGRVAVVTGGNGGLGREVARGLASAGALVVIACRDVARGRAAAAELTSSGIRGSVEAERLDLAELASVRGFAAAVAERHPRIDVLVNNAGVMAPARGRTADGFELQFGTNHLGPFALTGLLLDCLRGGRVVAVSSIMHSLWPTGLSDIRAQGRYSRWPAYGRSKLADLQFTFELQRRADRVGFPLTAVAAHPGYADTNLQTVSLTNPLARQAMTLANSVLAVPARTGALPILCAATLPGLPGGSFLGPGERLGFGGSPALVEASRRAHDEAQAEELWTVSEKATGVTMF